MKTFGLFLKSPFTRDVVNAINGGLNTPSASNPFVTASYVQSYLQGFNQKPNAVWATTAALTGSWTYNNTTKTLTRTTNGALEAQDGVTPLVNDIGLIKNQVSLLTNGLYIVTQVGNGSTPTILTRQSNMDISSEFNGASITVNSGSTQSGYIYLFNYVSGFVMGTNDVQFTQINSTSGLLKADGSVPLTANWAAGDFAATFNSVQVGSAANTISGLATIINGAETLTLPTVTGTLALAADYIRKDGAVALTSAWAAGQSITATNFVITGTAGNGYFTGTTQSSNPTSLANGAGYKLFADSSGRLSWIGNSFAKTFDGLANTADRVYTLRDESGIVLLMSNTLSGQAANTAIAGLSLINGTTASSGNQQYSPYTLWQGRGWKTNAAAESQSVAFRAYIIPVQGAVNPTGYLTFDSSVNGASFTSKLILNTLGDMGLGTTAPTNYGSTYVNFALNGSTGGEIDFMSNGTRVGAMYNDASTFRFFTFSNNDIVFFTNTTANERMRILGSRTAVSIGVGSNPTAYLHLGAGTAAANTAPFKFTTQAALLTVAETGAVEYAAPFLYLTSESTDRRLVQLGGRNAQSGTSYTATTSDVNKIVGLTNVAARAVTLPAASTIPAGNPIWFKDEAGTAAASNITFTPNGADTIESGSAINTNGGAKGLYSNGTTGWFIL